jgi:hypothetical protein
MGYGLSIFKMSEFTITNRHFFQATQALDFSNQRMPGTHINCVVRLQKAN